MVFQYTLEGYTPNVFLGYSVEPSCLSQPFVQHMDREKRGYIMTKRLFFLENGAWPPHYFEAASNATGIQFIIGANNDVDDPNPVLPQGVKNSGFLSQSAFVNTLSRSLVLVGVGMPVAFVNSPQRRANTVLLISCPPYCRSPTPYEALCLGVPFINPVFTVSTTFLEAH